MPISAPNAIRRISLMLVGLALMALPVFAQVSGATLSGTVRDASGAIVAGAQVAIKNVSTGIERNAVSDSNGLYSAPNLVPGVYDLTIRASGFRTEERRGIVLNVGMSKVVDSTMSVGQVSQEVVVNDVAPLLQLGSSESSAVVESRTVKELPLNGRSWTDLAALQPGVISLEDSFNAASGLDRGLKGFGAQLSISGGRPVQNNYRLDGVSVNDYSNGGPSNVLGGALGVDAIQEFSVITSNYSAQYGRTSGGVVNAVTRSGTNDFHGSAYEFFRDSALDARNYFDYDPNGNPYKASFERNQFGGSAGGPIIKNRTFIFGDYEGIRQTKGIATQAIVPSAAARQGNLSTGTVTVDPAAAKYLAFYPLPNVATPVGSDAGIFSFTGQQAFNEDFFTTKVDHTLSEKTGLSATYLFDNTPYSAPDGLDLTLKGHHIRRQTGALAVTHVFSPTLLNTFHIGMNRVAASINQNMAVLNSLAADDSLAAIPGQGPARIFMSGFANMPGGIGGAASVIHGYTSLQGYDDVFLTRGSHSLKFGVSLENIRSNTTAFQGAGDWTFGSLSDFLTNKPLSFTGSLGGATPRNVRQLIVGSYVQDDWRIRKNLTLNLGLRYEMATVPSEVHGKYVSLPYLTAPQSKIGGQLFSNPTLRNFEPRLGFAWDPTGHSQTVVHGSFGVFDVLPLPYEMDLLEANAAPFSEVGSVQSGLDGKFYTGAYSLLTPQTLTTAYVQQNPGRNYVMTWSLNVQRQITPSLEVVAGYVGSHGLHQQFKVDDSNMTLPTLTPSGYVFPYSTTGSLPTLNPAFGAIRSLWWNGSSSYNALQIGATKRMSKGIQFQASYTWSKSLDTSSSGAGSDSYGNSLSSLHWYNLRLNKSLSDFNTPRVLTLSTIWDVPAPSATGTFGRTLLKGWQLGNIFTAQDGQPFTLLIGGDPLGQNSSDPFAFPDRLNGPGCGSLINPGNVAQYIKLQCFSMPTAPSQAFYNQYCNPVAPYPTCINLRGDARRNIISGPGLVNLDFSIYKNTPLTWISERLSSQIRLEFFNVLNHTNFQAPLSNNVLFDPTGTLQSGAGALTQTSHDAREIQLALKLVW